MRAVLKKDCRGRTDPFGLLVVVVMLAVSVTIGVQVYAERGAEELYTAEKVCADPCLRVAEHRNGGADLAPE